MEPIEDERRPVCARAREANVAHELTPGWRVNTPDTAWITDHESRINALFIMQRMWSPWRSEYVESAAQRSPADSDRSLFTRLEQEGNDEENLILWRGEQVFVIMNRYPYNNGHLLIVPYHEVQAYDALTPEEQMAIARAIDRCIRWLRHAVDPDGFNVGMNLEDGSGAGLPEHLHVHVVPRWNGDTNFMTTTRETRVLPESLATTYERLQHAIDAVERAASP